MRGREKQPKTILIKNPRWRTRPITHARGCHIIISVEAKKKGGNIRSKLFVFICMMIDAPSNVSSSSFCPGMNYGNEMQIYDPLLLFFLSVSAIQLIKTHALSCFIFPALQAFDFILQFSFFWRWRHLLAIVQLKTVCGPTLGRIKLKPKEIW